MSATRTIGFFILLGIVSSLLACKQVRSDAPILEDFEPPVTDPVSYMAGNLTFNIADLEAKVNKALSTTLVNEETFQGKKGEAWRLRVERTGPIKITYEKRRVYFSAPIQVWYTNPIGLRKSENRKSRRLCALAVNFTSPVSVGPHWHLLTRTRFDQYRWIVKPTVRLLGLNISVQGLAETMLNKRKSDIEQAIDRAVHHSIHLDRQVGKVWRDMQKPLRIARKPENIWLLPKPFSIATAPVYGNAKQITIPLQIAFKVDTRLGPQPTIDTLQPLPRLLSRNALPDTARLEVLAFIPYNEVNQVLARTLEKDKLKLAGGNITIKKASLYGSGRKLILKAEVGGAVHGTLFFHGRPAYDTLTNTLRMQNVDFDVDTKEELLATADWLLHDNLRDTIQAAMVIPLKHPIASLPDKIQTAFERAKVGQKTDLAIDTFQLVPQRIVIRPEGVQILIKVKSKVAVKVKKL